MALAEHGDGVPVNRAAYRPDDGGPAAADPGACPARARPRAATAGATPAVTSTAKASSALAALYSPGMLVPIRAAAPPGPATSNSCPRRPASRPVTRQVAVGSPAADAVTV